MWMIICFLRSQCKNKVTNMADSKCNLQSSMAKEEDHVMSRDTHNEICENHVRDPAKNRPVGPLHELDMNRDIENARSISAQSQQPFPCENHKTQEELDMFVYSGLRADKSKKEGFSKCLSAPILLLCANKSSKGALLKAEEPICLTTTKVYPDVTISSIQDPAHTATTEESCEPICPAATKVHSGLTVFSNKDHSHLEATELSCDMTGVLSVNTSSILPADKCYSYGVDLNIGDAAINQKPSEKSHEDFNHETGLVRYFETHIELIGTITNEAHIVDGAVKEDNSSEEQDCQLSKLEISKAFGKKSKTWTSFCDSENHSVHFQPQIELEPKRLTDVHNGSMRDKTEHSPCNSFLKKRPHVSSNTTDDVCNIKEATCILSDDQRPWKYNDHLPDHPGIADEQPEPSNVSQSQRAKKERHQALLHTQMVRERLWKYHRNCCDEYQPCQTASKVLKQIKALEKTQLMQNIKQSPPSDEDLLEENPSIPPLPSLLSEDHARAKPAFFSTMTCTSLPNLSQYGSHQVCASHDAPSLKTLIQASVNVNDSTAIKTTSSASHLDLHGKDVSAYNMNLAFIKDQTESLVRSEKELNNVSSCTLALPINEAPAVDVVGGKTRLDDRSLSNLALPTINAQTHAMRSKNEDHLSASQLKLPTICEPFLGVAVQKNSLEHMMRSNFYLPVVGIHKIGLVKSLPAIKILEVEDHARDSQSMEAEILSSKIITVTDPEIDRKPTFENQGIQLNLEIKTQQSKILSEPGEDGVSTNEENNMAAISSSTSNLSLGIIPNHGEVAPGERESTHTQDPPKPTEFSNAGLDTQTHLTTSVSCSDSFQDGEEVSDWPKIADLVKHSSTISLSSNFDILNHHLVPHFKLETLYNSNKSNTDLNVDKFETMENQACDIHDHKNMVLDGLSFNCTLLHQYNMEPEDRNNSIGMENETFYIQEGTSQHCGTPSEEKARLTILDRQGMGIHQSDINSHVLQYDEEAQIQMKNLERESHNLDSHIINGDTVDHTSYENTTQTSNLDMVVNSGIEVHTRIEETEDAVYANDQTGNHKGHQLTTPFNSPHSEEQQRPEDLSEDLTCPPGTKLQTTGAEDTLSQANMIDIRNYNDLSPAVIKDKAVDFEGYEKGNEKVNSNLSMVDINHVAENFKEISNIIQNVLSSVSTSASEICTLAGSKRDILGAEASSDGLKTSYENDDFRGSKNKLEDNYCDESVNALVKASGDVPNCTAVCNSDVTYNNGQANRVGAMNTSLCNTEIPLKANQQLLGIHKSPKTHSKQTWSNQKSKTNEPLKTSNNVHPATAKDELDLKEYLSSRVYRRPFHSVFTFSRKTSSREDSEAVKNSTLEGEPSASDSNTSKPPLVLSNRYTENKTMEAVEYLTYLYARSPKPKACPESLMVASDMDDISVLANLNFCKVAFPGEIEKQEMLTNVQEVYEDPNVEPADPEHVYIPPSKEELKADNELAVLHVICTLKKSLELSHKNEMEAD